MAFARRVSISSTFPPLSYCLLSIFLFIPVPRTALPAFPCPKTLTSGRFQSALSSIPLLGLVAGALLILTAAAAGHSFWLLAAYLTSIAPNSFFPNHTMFYYLYYPIIFLLVFIARLMRTRYWPVALISVIVLLNPVVNLSQIAFRLRHPAPNFEIKSIHLIDQAVTQAVKSGQTRIKLSNWEVTPNLNHAIDNQALPLFLSGPQKDRFHYSYSRDTQILTLTPRP